MACNTVVLFRGESNFGNIGSLVTALADGFGRLSFDPVIVDIFHGGYENRLMEIIRSRKIIAFISVRGFGLPPSHRYAVGKLTCDLPIWTRRRLL